MNEDIDCAQSIPFLHALMLKNKQSGIHKWKVKLKYATGSMIGMCRQRVVKDCKQLFEKAPFGFLPAPIAP